MKEGTFTVVAHTALTRDMFKLVLAGDTSAICAPGQFVDIRLDGFYLRRPISVCDWDSETLTLVYKCVGAGTRYLAGRRAGDTLDLLSGLGNGFSIENHGTQPLLIGGGAGIPPLYALSKALLRAGARPTAILGFNTAAEIYGQDAFSALGLTVIVATADGSAGTRGFVTDAMAGLDYDYFYTCGPMPMYRAIERVVKTSGQYSFEERMGCGFGACMGCSCQTKNGAKRLCKDGPVLEREEILWQE